jgi:hypothetical protein
VNNCRIPTCKHAAAPHSDYCLMHDVWMLRRIMEELDIETPAPIAPPVKIHSAIMAMIREGAWK